MKTVSKLCLYILIVAALLSSPKAGPLLVCFAFYFAPSIAAFMLERSRIGSIFLCNILLGWTIVGWIVLLIWALLGKTAGRMPQAYRHHALTSR